MQIRWLRLTQEQENVKFLEMVESYGAYALEEKIQKRDLTRKYYRRWPYDGFQKRTGMDSIDLVMPTTPLQDILDAEAHAALLDGLTPRELEVALWAEAGYKPKDMADMRGVSTSNADRWIKHSVKGKFQVKRADSSS